MSDIKIKKQNVLDAYRNASDEQRELLEHLFGRDVCKPLDVRERIKTFTDAAQAVGIDDPEEWEEHYSNLEPDILAYLKLRIITKALNEGWEPKFIPGEYRWAPYFLLYTKEEIEKIDAEKKARVVFRSVNIAFANGGVSYAFANSASANVNASFGSRLAFKSEELAEYAGKQFTEIYADFIFKAEE